MNLEFTRNVACQNVTPEQQPMVVAEMGALATSEGDVTTAVSRSLLVSQIVKLCSDQGLKVKNGQCLFSRSISSSSVTSRGLEPDVTSFFFCDLINTSVNLCA